MDVDDFRRDIKKMKGHGGNKYDFGLLINYWERWARPYRRNLPYA
tara:strand:- start:978 stop:1112 length:135 start_codon:yes stop_codon:yes gene_type:complete